MATRSRTLPRARAAQRGLTLIEFMVSITLGMIMVAALATLIADQSNNRAEVDRAGRLIENGRYAIRAMADDMQMAGYWGELSTAPTYATTTLPDPCLTTTTDVGNAMGLHVQGYGISGPGNGYNATTTAVAPTCLANVKAGTDILVLRRVEPDPVPGTTTGLLLQTGLDSATQNFTSVLQAGATPAPAVFNLVKKDLATAASIRKVVVRIYYVSTCNVCSPSDGIPSLKMWEFAGGATQTLVLAEGIENMQVDFGVDSDGDGAPDGTDADPETVTGSNAANWANAVSAKVYLLARGDLTPGYTDTKTYAMGTAGTLAAQNDRYKRHVFMQSVRFVNPSARRSS